MGVLVDYFAASRIELERIDPASGPAGGEWTYVDCKGWLDGLDRLTADLTERDVSEFGDETPIVAAEDSALVRVHHTVTEALTAVTDARLNEHADEELLDEHELRRNIALRDLARSAVRSGRDLYYWASL